MKILKITAIIISVVLCHCISFSETLNVVTYNVLADETNRNVRIPKLMEILKNSDADVIALQEVTPWFVEDLKKQDWLKSYKYPTASDSVILVRGLLILVKGSIDNFNMEMLPGKQGRALLIMDVEIKKMNFAIANCHLESFLEDGPTRRDQLDRYFIRLEEKDNVLFLGDFNFGDNEPESNSIPKTYLDMWRVVHKDNAGYTWNMEKSHMAKEGSFPGEKSRRLDRIFYKSKKINPISISIMGDTSVHGNIFPSDHFGLKGVFKIE